MKQSTEMMNATTTSWRNRRMKYLAMVGRDGEPSSPSRYPFSQIWVGKMMPSSKP